MKGKRSSELDHMLERWGTIMAGYMAERLETCGVALAGRVSHLVYSDPYVRNPTVVRLFLDTVAALQKLNGKPLEVTVLTEAPFNDRGTPRLISHSWESGEQVEQALKAYAMRIGVKLEVRLQKVPHGRYMIFRFADGREAQIVMDQGFGAWSLAQRGIGFDFSLSPGVQAENLGRFTGLVQRQSHGLSYMVAIAE